MPGGSVCSIVTCKNNSKKAKEKGEKLMFFTFPKDAKIKKQWMYKCYRKDKWSSENKRICSKHFKPDDFTDEMQARLMNTQPKKLKSNAIPSLFLLPTDKKKCEVSERTKRKLRKENKFIVENLLQEQTASLISEPSFELPETSIVIEEVPQSSKDTELEILKRELEVLKIELEKLKNENISLKQKIVQSENNENTLQLKLQQLEKQINVNQLSFKERAAIEFKDFLTPNQIDIALKNKSKARWTSEEFSRAFTLCYFNKRSYIYLRETLHYPLPGLSTLQRWAKNLKNGYLEDVLSIMETSGRTNIEQFKTTVLSFDEVEVSSLHECCEKDDDISAPYSKMQVVMARGLFHKWKQPIYINFDQKMTKEILEDIIRRLYEIKYAVVACVSDCATGTQGLWKAMGISVKKTFVEHPVTKKRIYFFADAPDSLKLLRNKFCN